MYMKVQLYKNFVLFLYAFYMLIYIKNKHLFKIFSLIRAFFLQQKI